MIKRFLLCLLVVATFGAPQGGYRPPKGSFSQRNQFSQGPFRRKESEESFAGLDSRERFGGGGFRQSLSESDERFDGQQFKQGPQPQRIGSGERFSGGFSREIKGGFAPGPVGGFAPGPVGGFGGAPRLGGGFGGGFTEHVIGAPVIAILRDEREDSGDGSYSFVFESEDGIRREESGTPTGPDGAVVQQGSWSFIYPDGTPAEFRFVADENGYQVDSNLLPTPHPIPAHALAQIEKAERERAAGIIHDGQYRAEDHFGGGVPLPGPFSSGPGPDAFRKFPSPQVQPQLISSGFKDTSIEDSFRGNNRFQSSFEEDRFAPQSHFGGGGISGGGLAPQPRFGGGGISQSVGVPLRSASSQGFGSRFGSPTYRPKN